MKEEAAARKAKEKAKKLENRPGSAPAPPPSRRARAAMAVTMGFPTRVTLLLAVPRRATFARRRTTLPTSMRRKAFEVGMRQNAMEYDAADVNKDKGWISPNSAR